MLQDDRLLAEEQAKVIEELNKELMKKIQSIQELEMRTKELTSMNNKLQSELKQSGAKLICT